MILRFLDGTEESHRCNDLRACIPTALCFVLMQTERELVEPYSNDGVGLCSPLLGIHNNSFQGYITMISGTRAVSRKGILIEDAYATLLNKQSEITKSAHGIGENFAVFLSSMRSSRQHECAY